MQLTTTKKGRETHRGGVPASLGVAAATRAERRAPQDRSRASLPRRVRAVGGESSPGDPAAPSSSVPMDIVLAVVMVASWRAGEVDGRGEALRKLRRQRRRRLAVGMWLVADWEKYGGDVLVMGGLKKK